MPPAPASPHPTSGRSCHRLLLAGLNLPTSPFTLQHSLQLTIGHSNAKTCSLHYRQSYRQVKQVRASVQPGNTGQPILSPLFTRVLARFTKTSSMLEVDNIWRVEVG